MDLRAFLLDTGRRSRRSREVSPDEVSPDTRSSSKRRSVVIDEGGRSEEGGGGEGRAGAGGGGRGGVAAAGGGGGGGGDITDVEFNEVAESLLSWCEVVEDETPVSARFRFATAGLLSMVYPDRTFSATAVASVNAAIKKKLGIDDRLSMTDCTMTVKDGKYSRRCWRNLRLKEARAPGDDTEVCVCVSPSVILPLVVVLFLSLTLSLSLFVSLSLSLFVSLSLSLCGGRERVTVCVSLYSD